MTDVTDMTPSTRDLMQYISPNPADRETVYLVRETTGWDLKKFENEFAGWEDQNIAAVIIDTRGLKRPLPADYLKKAASNMECPLIRFENVKTEDNIYEARRLGFHGIITELAGHDQSAFHSLYSQAESVNFRLIPVVRDAGGWQTVLSVRPKFVYVEAGDIPDDVVRLKIWLLGKKDLEQSVNLKCVIEEKNG